MARKPKKLSDDENEVVIQPKPPAPVVVPPAPKPPVLPDGYIYDNSSGRFKKNAV